MNFFIDPLRPVDTSSKEGTTTQVMIKKGLKGDVDDIRNDKKGLDRDVEWIKRSRRVRVGSKSGTWF